MVGSIQENLRDVQLHCVQIMQQIDSICRKYDIKYSLTGGSVIGFHLYKGFIPWDDDIDLMMTRENYEKFIEVCRTELPQHLVLENYENGLDKTVLFSKIVDVDTTVVERKPDGKERVSGVFVDITVFDKLPKQKLKRNMWKIFSKVAQCCRKRGIEEVHSMRDVVRNIGIILVSPFSSAIYWQVKRLFTQDVQNGYDYAELLAGLPISYSQQIFDEYIDIEFEGARMMIVKEYMDYLETRYGRREFYRQQRDGDFPHHLVYANCKLPYREHIKQNKSN